MPAGAQCIGRDITERKRAEALRAGQSQVLELLAKGGTLREALTLLVHTIEAEVSGIMCSILLLNEEGKHLRHGAVPSALSD